LYLTVKNLPEAMYEPQFPSRAGLPIFGDPKESSSWRLLQKGDVTMFKIATLIAAFLIGGCAIAAAEAPSEATCKAMWTKADADKNGSVEGAEAEKYLAAIKKSGKSYDANNDGKLSQDEFMKACKDGVFASIQ
jgi:hypothetical protein